MKKNPLINNRLWSKATLKNPFELLKEPCYEEKEISDLISLFENSLDSQQENIVNLLRALEDFRFATTEETYFKRVRDQVLTEKDLLKKINLIGEAILNFEKECHTHPTQTILQEAKNYCIKAIEKQLQLLNQSNDKIYKLYLEKDNTLKRVLNSNSNFTKSL